MYELVDLKILISTVVYAELERDTNAKFDLIKDDVDAEIKSYTDYTAAILSDPDYAIEKRELAKPYAWILEYYCLSFISKLTELNKQRIFSNYKEAKDKLQAFPNYVDENAIDNFSSIYGINDIGEF